MAAAVISDEKIFRKLKLFFSNFCRCLYLYWFKEDKTKIFIVSMRERDRERKGEREREGERKCTYVCVKGGVPIICWCWALLGSADVCNFLTSLDYFESLYSHLFGIGHIKAVSYFLFHSV